MCYEWPAWSLNTWSLSVWWNCLILVFMATPIRICRSGLAPRRRQERPSPWESLSHMAHTAQVTAIVFCAERQEMTWLFCGPLLLGLLSYPDVLTAAMNSAWRVSIQNCQIFSLARLEGFLFLSPGSSEEWKILYSHSVVLSTPDQVSL